MHSKKMRQKPAHIDKLNKTITWLSVAIFVFSVITVLAAILLLCLVAVGY